MKSAGNQTNNMLSDNHGRVLIDSVLWFQVTTLTGEDGNTEVKENNQEALKSLEGFVKDAGKQFDGFVQNLQKFWSD